MSSKKKYANLNLNTLSINRKISYYLIFSYLYYEKDESLISDSSYDELCKDLFNNFEEVKNSDHPNKNLIDKFDLECGSGFGITFTNRIKSSAEQLKESGIRNIY